MIITYHNIGQVKGFNTVAFNAFQSQLLYLKKHFSIVSIDHYVNQIRQSGKNASGEVVITFDDGYTSFQEMALPFLERHGMPASLFICTNYIGKSNEWDKEDNRLPILNEKQLKEIAVHPLITIGAHSVTHRSLSTLSDKELQTELRNSKFFLEACTQQPIQYLAYPYGQYHLNVNKQVFKAAAEKAILQQ